MVALVVPTYNEAENLPVLARRIFGLNIPNTRMIVVDDVFFHGDALNASPSTEKGRGVREFLNIASGRDDYMKIVLPISNGVMLMWKQTG